MLKKALTLTLLSLLAPSVLLAKPAYCSVESGGMMLFEGKCNFGSEQGGSFYLSSYYDNVPLFEGIDSISVTIIQKGFADVRGLTTDGINSRWGEAQRSYEDRACWVGADFRICAR